MCVKIKQNKIKVRNLPVILQFYLTVIYRNLRQVTGNVTGALNPNWHRPKNVTSQLQDIL